MDIVFLLVFFVILFIPMSNIDKKTKYSKDEGRELSSYTPFINKGKINYNFGNKFDEWFNDRFFLRAKIIRLYVDCKYKMAINYYENSKAFINKRNNWVSQKFNVNSQNLSSDDLKSYHYSLKALKAFADKNNIKLYILVVPDKFEMYPEKHYPYLRFGNKHAQIIEIKNYLKKDFNINIIDPYNELKTASINDLTYFKTDHHWTEYGAYIGYRKLINEIKKDFPYIYVYKTNDARIDTSKKISSKDKYFINGQTYKNLNLNDETILDQEYKYYTNKLYKLDKLETNKKHYTLYNYQNNINNDLKLVIIGDSMGGNLAEFLPYSFKSTMRIYYYINAGDEYKFNMKQYEKIITDFKPDAMVVTFFGSGINRLNKLYKKE